MTKCKCIPSWDFTVVLGGLRRPSFETLWALSQNTVLLVALTSLKKGHIVLRPDPAITCTKVSTNSFRDQVASFMLMWIIEKVFAHIIKSTLLPS